MSEPRSWDEILEPGEEILWQGRPDTRLIFPPERKGTMVLGLLLVVVVVGVPPIMMLRIMPIETMPTVIIVALGFPVALGLALVLGQPFWTRHWRRRTWYTLTNRRAFITTDLPILGKRLQSWPVKSGAPLIVTKGKPPTVWFAEKRFRSNRRTRITPIGFERIADAQKVARKILALREEAQ